jgi:outer membrane protein OmpA-like peptidoglycan-associated protein
VYALLPLLLAPVHAQEAVSADGFNAWGFTSGAQDGDLRDPVTFNRPGQINVAEWYATGVLGFAKAPLYFVEEVEGSDPTRTAALDNVLGLDLVGGVSPFDRVRLDLAVPVFAASSGSFGGGGPAFGDITASAMVVPLTFGTDDEGGIGIRPWVALPTGNAGRFLGSRALRGGADASVTGAFGPWTLTGSGGLAFNGQVESLNIGGSDLVVLGASVGRLIGDRTGVTLEGHLRMALDEQVEPLRESPGEALVSVRHRLESGAHLMGGAGTSVTPGVGASEFRLFVGGGYGVLKRPPPDTDGDGFLDEVDQCPEAPETLNGYRDDDGCPDELARVILHGVHDSEEPLEITWTVSIDEGEPVEYVGTRDVVLNDQIPGQTWDVYAVAGCLDGEAETELAEGDNRIEVPVAGQAYPTTFMVVDVDDQPIPNARLKLVEQPAVCPFPEPLQFLPAGEVTLEFWPGEYQVTASAEEYETRVAEVEVVDGEQTVKIQLSPTRTDLQDDEIRILEKVLFETASAKIKPVSFQLLDEVAAVLIDRDEIRLLEVQGHADERGSSEFNLKLSTNRAKAVRQYLVDAGVAPERLVIQGYGEDQPLQAGSDEAAWAQNRRVQFVIRETADEE